MNIEEVKSKIEDTEKALAKIKELMADFEVCSSEITKTLISNAVKKLATAVSDFKIEG